MPATFPRTLRALRAERSRAPLIAGVVAAALAAAWLAWLTLATVPEYRTSLRARLEVEPAPHRIAAPTAGRVVAATLTVGAPVAAGAVLVELDAAAERIARDRAGAQLAAIEPELASVDREIAVEDAGLTQGGAAGRARTREIVARQ